MGDTAQQCAERMHDQLEQLKAALRRDNMVLNDGKQQVLGLTKEIRQAWNTYGVAAQVTKDLGVSHHGYNDKHPQLDGKLKELQVTSGRIRSTGGAQRVRAHMMASVLYGRCLYGAESHYIAKRQAQKMRRIMRKDMGDAHSRRPDAVRLLTVP